MSHTFTVEELLAYDGSDASKPVYIAVKGVVYDVSASREFYGKGGRHRLPMFPASNTGVREGLSCASRRGVVCWAARG